MTEKEQTPGQTDRAARPSILVVASDPKLLKLLGMALSLELGCPVLTVDSAKRAEEAAKGFTPALLIIDEQFLSHNAHDLSAHLHGIVGLEHLPTLFLNVSDLSRNGHQGYPTGFLAPSWKVEALYAEVQALLAGSPADRVSG